MTVHPPTQPNDEAAVEAAAEAVALLKGGPTTGAELALIEAVIAAAVPFVEARVRQQAAAEIETAAGIVAARHKPDEKRGGCTCGFCAWSVEHVAIMSVRDGAELRAALVVRGDR